MKYPEQTLLLPPPPSLSLSLSLVGTMYNFLDGRRPACCSPGTIRRLHRKDYADAITSRKSAQSPLLIIQSGFREINAAGKRGSPRNSALVMTQLKLNATTCVRRVLRERHGQGNSDGRKSEEEGCDKGVAAPSSSWVCARVHTGLHTHYVPPAAAAAAAAAARCASTRQDAKRGREGKRARED